MARPVVTIQIIQIHPLAPPKPAFGSPCNGCGVCCLAEPCPVARRWLRAGEGACPAVSWHAADGIYRCGLAVAPQHHLRWLPAWLAPLISWWLFRRIAAGRGCDSDAEVEHQAG